MYFGSSWKASGHKDCRSWCDNAMQRCKRIFFLALYVPTEELIYVGGSKHCIAEMLFAFWIACRWLFLISFYIHLEKSSGWISTSAFTTHWMKAAMLQKSIFPFKRKWWCFHETSNKEESKQIAFFVISSFQMHGISTLHWTESLLPVDYPTWCSAEQDRETLDL